MQDCGWRDEPYIVHLTTSSAPWTTPSPPPVARIVPCDAADTARRAALEALLQRLEAQPAIDIGPWRRDELYER